MLQITIFLVLTSESISIIEYMPSTSIFDVKMQFYNVVTLTNPKQLLI